MKGLILHCWSQKESKPFKNREQQLSDIVKFVFIFSQSRMNNLVLAGPEQKEDAPARSSGARSS